MRKLFLLILLISCLSCSAQKVTPAPIAHGQMTVITISGDEITFKASQGSLFIGQINENAFKIPSNLQLEEGRIYYVSFQHQDCENCFKRKILILGYTLDVLQVQKDKSELMRSAPFLSPGE